MAKPIDIVRAALDQFAARAAAIEADMNAIPDLAESEARSVTDAESETLAALIVERSDVLDKIATHEARVAQLEADEKRMAALAARPALQFIKPHETTRVDDIRSMDIVQLTDVVRRSAEDRDIGSDHAASLIRRHRKDLAWVRSIAARSTDAYESAFEKLLRGQEYNWSNEERAAVATVTTTQGGFAVPAFLDSTMMLTNTGSANAMRQISRVETLTTGNTWKGLTSAGVSASVDGELAEVSDDSPTFAQPSINLYRNQAFVQASFEAYEDIPNLAAEVLAMFADAKDRLEGAKHATGSGTNEPWGIFAALDANTNVEFTSTTAATIGLVDLTALRRAVGARFRGNGTWVMNPTYADAIRTLGTAIGASYSVDITGGNTDKLLGRPVVETDDAPATQTTTVRDNEIVYGDFSKFIIVDKPGSASVEFVPLVFNTATNLPDGRRGWYMSWRNGSDSVLDTAFGLLQDKTSA